MRQVLDELKTMNGRITRLEENMATKSDIQDLRIELRSEIQDVRNELKSDIQDVKSNANHRFDTLEMKMSLLEKKMATKDDVADIPAIKVAVFETNGTVKRIEATQEHHERILDLLSRRSIEQEAELKRIK